MKRYLALFALLLLPMLAWGQGNTVTLSGSGAPTGGCAFIMRYIDVVGQVEYACTTSGTWFQVGPGAAGAVSLSSTTNLTGNKQFDSGAFTLVWNTSSNSGTANPFSVADFATNTGTGYLFTVSSGSSSTIKPFRVCYRGTTNCFNFDTTTLTTSGSAVIDATKLSGNLPALNGASLTNVDAATLQTHAAAYFQQALTLTTTGTSGAATLVGGTLNIPQYTGGGGGITNSAPNLHLMESDGTNAIDSGIVRSTNDYAFPGAITATTSVGAGTAPTTCGTATGCFGATANSTAGTQTASQGYFRLDTSVWKLRQTNGAAETQIATYADNLGAFASTTSAQLAGVISDETGSGALVFGTSPTLTTPTLGVATATSINKMAITAPATGSTLAVADGKTATISNTLTFAGTDSSSIAFGGGGTVTYTIATGAKALATASITANTCTAAQTDTATGAATTDTISFTPNADITGVTGYGSAGTLVIYAYPTANTVNFRVCNTDGTNAVTPGAVTLNWRVSR